MMHKDGSIRWILARGKTIRDPDGQVIRMVGTDTDITRLKLIEGELRKSEEKYRTLAENTNDVVYSVDSTGVVQYISPQVSRYGLTPNAIIGRSFLEFIYPPDRDALRDHFGGDFSGGTVRDVSEFRIEDTDGNIHWLEERGELQRDAGGDIIGLAGVIRDITIRKKAEQELCAREEHLRLLLNTANSLIICLDKNANITVFNKECEKVTGYTCDEVIGKNWPEIFLPEDHYARGVDDFDEWVRQHPQDKYEGPLITKSGEIRTILWSNSAIFPSDSGELTAIAVGQDITEHKRAEEALEKSEERYRMLVEDMPALMCQFSVSGVLTFVNSAYRRYFNKTSSELIGKDFFRLIPVNYRDAVRNHLRSLSIEHPIDSIEHQVIAPDGDIRWQKWINRALFNDEGQVTAYQAIGYDITDRKQAEKILQESEKRYRGIWEKSPFGICLTDQHGRYQYVNKAYCRMYEFEEHELIGKSALEIVLPREAREEFQRTYSSHYRSGTPISRIEMETVKKSGERLWIGYSTDFIRLGSGRDYMVAMVVDITKRKLSEFALRKSEEKYRLLVENAARAIFTIDFNGTYLYLNSIAARYLGGNPGDFVGKPMPDFFPGDEARSHMQHLREAIRSGKRLVSETHDTFYDGRRWFRTVIQPLADSSSEVPSALLIAEDITERKINEIRNLARLRLLDNLRAEKNINNLLAMACSVIRDSGLYRRIVFIMLDKNEKISHRGDIGHDGSPDHIAQKALTTIKNAIGSPLSENYRIGNSFLIPSPTRIMPAEGANSLAINKQQVHYTASWEKGYRLYVPVVNENNRYDGWLIVEEPLSEERPTEDDVFFLEEIAEIVAKDVRRIEWVEQLRKERIALHEKNVALREVLEHIEEEKFVIKQEVAKNVDQNLLPALKKIVRSDGTVNKSLYDLVVQELENLATASGGLLRLHSRLSPREVDICNLIKAGLSSQEIADTLYITLATVKKHRETIRKKFGIANKKINLTSFLKEL
ncbi:MAG: PAS domain S-box protein [Candidatus Zixiibacteriota bacterium]|nr:MAG: PAS domain S-box protein [candidate division Zixibacteria bacterium]